MFGQWAAFILGGGWATAPCREDRSAIERHDLQRKRLADPRLGVVAVQLMNSAAPLGRQEDAASIALMGERIALIQQPVADNRANALKVGMLVPILAV